MNAVELLRSVERSPRRPQDAIAEGLESFLLADDARLMCVNAETGIGKTLAYAAPAAIAALRGGKVVVSTHTMQQLNQVLAVMHRVAAVLPAPVAVARRLGRANFISPGRVARLLANRDDLDEDARALLNAARAHAGLIDDFEAEHGVLPVSRADICLTASCTDQRSWKSQRAEVGDSGIVVQTHAMSVLDAVRGDVDADIAIYDEGDALPSAAAGFAESRVTALDLAAVRERYALAGLGDAIAEFESWAGRAAGAGEVVFKQDDAEAVRHAKAIRAALKGPDDEHVRDLRRALSEFVNLDPARSARRGAVVVPAPGGHAFEVLALDPGRVLRRARERTGKTLFVSATLVVGSDNFAPFLRAVGVDDRPDVRKINAGLEDFGTMSFALADRSVPKPLDGGGRVPAFDDYAERVVRAAIDEGGRVLVLAPSFADGQEMARRIDGVIAHCRGEALAGYLEFLQSQPNGVLVTPAAWGRNRPAGSPSSHRDPAHPVSAARCRPRGALAPVSGTARARSRERGRHFMEPASRRHRAPAGSGFRPRHPRSGRLRQSLDRRPALSVAGHGRSGSPSIDRPRACDAPS